MTVEYRCNYIFLIYFKYLGRLIFELANEEKGRGICLSMDVWYVPGKN